MTTFNVRLYFYSIYSQGYICNRTYLLHLALLNSKTTENAFWAKYMIRPNHRPSATFGLNISCVLAIHSTLIIHEMLSANVNAVLSQSIYISFSYLKLTLKSKDEMNIDI